MVCYSDKIKAMTAKVVGVFSAILLLIGLITAILGGMQMGAVQKPNDWSGFKGVDQSGFGVGVLILGAFVVLTGIFGLLTCKYKKPYFTCPFVGCTLVIGLVVLVIGVIIIGVAGNLVDIV
jgi:hypothetical protein